MNIQVNEFRHIPGENDNEYIKLLKEALERQKKITSKAIAKIKKLSNYSESPNNWIPCTPETMPEEAGAYLCTCKDAGRLIITLIKWQPRMKSWNLTGVRTYWKVIAWMPLPEPYKEG